MTIVSQREVKEFNTAFKLTIILSVVAIVCGISLFYLKPIIKNHYEKYRLEKDLASIDKVYSSMQKLIDEGSVSNTPSGMWELTLHDMSQMSTMADFNDELCKRLNVSNLGELEGDSFKSRAFKGSKYIIYMNEGSKELHITVPSNDFMEHEDVVY